MSDPTEPTEPLPQTPPGGATPPSGTAPPPPPTTQMPSTGAPGAPGDVGSGVPPVPPGGIPPTGPGQGLEYEMNDGDQPDDRPWYKKPGPIIAIVIIVLLLIAGLVWLISGGGSDDDNGGDEAARVILETVDQAGDALDRGFIASVMGPADAPGDFDWLEPQQRPGPENLGGSTGSSGQLEFAWAPNDTVSDPAAWPSTFEMVETSVAGFTPPGPTVDCVLSRGDEQNTTISMNVAASPPDATVDQVVTYTFPNHQFLVGDTVTCELVSTEVPETTTTSTTTTTTTTIPETTTTSSSTTTTEATTTTAETTTTTQGPTTTEGLTTVWDTLTSRDDLSDFVTLLEADGGDLVSVLQDQSVQLTVFAPDNAAIEQYDAEFQLPTDPDDVNAFLSRLILQGQALTEAQIASQATITVDGSTYEVTSNGSVTVGGGTITTPDLQQVNGFTQVMNAVPAPTS